MVLAPVIVQRAARTSVSCDGVDALLNENSAWIRIMSSFTNIDEQEPATSQSNTTLLLIPAKTSLQHLPVYTERGPGTICEAEMELSTFMRSAGLLKEESSNVETFGCYDTPRAAGGSNVGSKRMVDSSPTNVAEYGERPFIFRLNELESHIPFSVEGAAGTRASKRRDAENQGKTKISYCETNQISKKRQRESKIDPLSSPARSNQKSGGDFIFSPNRQQAASNLVNLKKGVAGMN
jgi:hypothetical protein